MHLNQSLNELRKYLADFSLLNNLPLFLFLCDPLNEVTTLAEFHDDEKHTFVSEGFVDLDYLLTAFQLLHIFIFLVKSIIFVISLLVLITLNRNSLHAHK